ncbi:MAG: TatD family hydrolase [Acidobacteriota bacterium]|nr:TatD family hydrolase [Acidobacteriota bacterium]
MIDSHCHLAGEEFIDDLDEVVRRSQEVGLTCALCVLDATNDAEAVRAARVSKLWPEIRFATGVHPHQAGDFVGRLDEVEALVRSAIVACEGVCALGEIGLDYHYDVSPREVQREVFRRQLRVARELACPIIIHTREADEETLEILSEETEGMVAGVFHCFTGDVAMAKRAIELGFYVSFSGILTFRSAESVRQAAAVVPLDRLLVETDAPYLAPVPHRGKRNEPALIVEIVKTLAQVQGVTVEDLVEATSDSFERLFKAKEFQAR